MHRKIPGVIALLVAYAALAIVPALSEADVLTVNGAPLKTVFDKGYSEKTDGLVGSGYMEMRTYRGYGDSHTCKISNPHGVAIKNNETEAMVLLEMKFSNTNSSSEFCGPFDVMPNRNDYAYKLETGTKYLKLLVQADGSTTIIGWTNNTEEPEEPFSIDFKLYWLEYQPPVAAGECSYGHMGPSGEPISTLNAQWDGLSVDFDEIIAWNKSCVEEAFAEEVGIDGYFSLLTGSGIVARN